MSKPRHYRVKWIIDLVARTPEQAAQQAFEMQRDPNCTAQVFEVHDEHGHHVARIDLMDQERKTP